MELQKCKDPRWRRLFLILAALLVFLATLFLYVLGWITKAGFLYSLAVTLLFCFALAGAIAFAMLLYALFRRWCEMRGGPPKGQGTPKTSGPSSVRLPSTIYKRPDPLIYSQYYLMAHGFAVTWDNPDIWLTELPTPSGTMVPVASHELLPNHTYRIHARIYNGSLEAPAVGLPVFFSFLTFGIGIVPTLIGVVAINLPVRGAIGHPQEAFHDWLTPATAGHYCIQVGLFWPDDAEPANNLGQENVDVKKLASPATFQFALRNDAPIPRHFRLEVDSYPPPVPPPCPEEPEPDPGSRGGTFVPLRRGVDVARLATHRRDAHPLPENWSVVFSPGPELLLRGGEQVDITATVTVPTTLPEPRPVNVNAFADGVLAGGVTLFVHS
jgi:hypothetical protein